MQAPVHLRNEGRMNNFNVTMLEKTKLHYFVNEPVLKRKQKSQDYSISHISHARCCVQAINQSGKNCHPHVAPTRYQAGIYLFKSSMETTDQYVKYGLGF